jgi:hypothetical protein
MDNEIKGLDTIDDTPDYSKTKEEDAEQFKKLHGIEGKKDSRESAELSTQ